MELNLYTHPLESAYYQGDAYIGRGDTYVRVLLRKDGGIRTSFKSKRMVDISQPEPADTKDNIATLTELEVNGDHYVVKNEGSDDRVFISAQHLLKDDGSIDNGKFFKAGDHLILFSVRYGMKVSIVKAVGDEVIEVQPEGGSGGVSSIAVRTLSVDTDGNYLHLTETKAPYDINDTGYHTDDIMFKFPKRVMLDFNDISWSITLRGVLKGYDYTMQGDNVITRTKFHSARLQLMYLYSMIAGRGSSNSAYLKLWKETPEKSGSAVEGEGVTLPVFITGVDSVTRGDVEEVTITMDVGYEMSDE